MAQAIGGTRYGIGVIEHSWCAPYWEQVAPACRRTVLDLHNIESVLHARCAAVEGPAHGLRAPRFSATPRSNLERTWLPRFSQVLTTSRDDAAAAHAIAPGAHVAVYPNAIPWVPLPRARG